jgi:hypothetical protein
LIKLVITGNCQAQVIEAMFESAAPNVSVSRFEPVFVMKEARKDAVLQAMHEADFVFAQRTSDDYFLSWLTPDFLRAAFGSKYFLWPNIYFDGYFPRTGYLYKHGIGKVQSPLEDYHLAPLMDAHRRGMGVEAAVQEVDQFGAEAAAGFEASFAELEQRERDVDVGISDLLRADAAIQRVVYTPNHPYNYVLAEMGARLARKAGIKFDPVIAEGIRYHLWKIYMPTFPTVARVLSLPFDEGTRYRGVEVAEVTKDRIVLGAGREYSTKELVEAYWAIYEKFPP